MNIWTTQIISDLTGLRGASLTRFCADLGIGVGKRGVSRQLGLGNIMTLVLAHSLLTDHGLRRDEAIRLAAAVEFDSWVEIVESEAQRWLFAQHDSTGQAVWVTTIVDTEGAADLLREAQPGWIVINLYTIARRVLIDAAIETAATQGAKESAPA
jgi:hypothetical protein